jgi:hypothetical protein
MKVLKRIHKSNSTFSKERGLKVIHSLVTIILFAAWTEQPSFAKSARALSKPMSSAGASTDAGARQNSSGTHPSQDMIVAKTAGANPIDTRIADPRRAPVNNFRPIDLKKIGIVGPSMPAQIGSGSSALARGGSQSSPPPTPGLAKNRIASGANGTVRNAVGVTAQSLARGMVAGPQRPTVVPSAGIQPSASKTIGVLGRNAVGNPTNGNAVTVGARSTLAIARPTPPPSVSAAIAMNHSVINGTAISRPGFGPATVGGAAKNVSTVISGSSFRPSRR